MAIPEQVKRQAMDAVSHRETTAQIRAFRSSGKSVSPGDQFTHRQEPRPEVRPIPDEVKRKAMDAVSHPETRAQIKLMRETGGVTPPNTPTRQTDRIAGKVAQLHQEEKNQEVKHKTVTRDGFGRENV